MTGKIGMSYKDICGYKDLQLQGLDDRCPIYTPLKNACNGFEECKRKHTLRDMERRGYPEDTWRDELDNHSRRVRAYIDEESGIWY